jgi:allantoicase
MASKRNARTRGTQNRTARSTNKRATSPRATGPRATPFWVRYMNLLQPRLGAEVLWASDQFFGAADRLIDPDEPVWKPGVYDRNGKWMDGWESRRRRDGGHDSCILRLCARAIVRGVDLDTAFFNGNQPVSAAIEGCDAGTGREAPAANERWWTVVPESPLGPSAHHRIASTSDRPCTHLRLHIFPDGGVARLRAYGEAVYDGSNADAGALHDLASFARGGQAIWANDQHFGSMHNLLLPGRGKDMGDGWETRRRRQPGNDFVLIRLGHRGTIERVELDTAHFRGNFPDRASLRAASIDGREPPLGRLITASATWPLLLDEAKLEADHVHEWRLERGELRRTGPVSHVRLDIFPDGGVSRLRLHGRLHRAAHRRARR